jgi:hypothetical protein
MMKPELKAAVRKYEVLAERRKPLHDQVADISKQMINQMKYIKSICDHPNVIRRESYNPGGYLNMACTTYWNECPICGATGPKTEKSHGHYG